MAWVDEDVGIAPLKNLTSPNFAGTPRKPISTLDGARSLPSLKQLSWLDGRLPRVLEMVWQHRR